MSRRDDTFILYYWEDYIEYEEENPTCYYCLSESTIQICLNALRFVGWPTRWRGDRLDNNPRFPKGETWNKIEAYGALAQKELLTDMTCDLEAGFASLAEAIENASPNSGLAMLAAAIAAQQTGGCNVNVNCCSGGSGRNGSGGAGSSAPSYSDVTQGFPPGDPPPDGFEDWSEFNSHKCGMATYLVNTLIDDIGRASTINFNLQTVATLAVILIPLIVDPIPGDELIVLCGILIAIHEQAEQLLDDMAAAMEERKDELICEFYAAQDSASAETAFENKWSEIWYASPYVNVFYDWAAIQSINTMVTSEMTNKLFEPQTSIRLPEGDCGNCLVEWELYDGFILEQESENVWIFQSSDAYNCAPVGDLYTASAGRKQGSSFVVGEWTIEVESGSIANVNSGTPNSCNYSWRGLYCGGTGFWEHQPSPPSFPVAMDSFTIRSNVPFTLRITIENEGSTECS